MNERIRQLYYECCDESLTTEQRYEKFAELIVKECIEVDPAEEFTKLLIEDIDMWLKGVHTSEEGRTLLTQTFIIANIKGYYGVEE